MDLIVSLGSVPYTDSLDESLGPRLFLHVMTDKHDSIHSKSLLPKSIYTKTPYGPSANVLAAVGIGCWKSFLE
jgi:hypothetical protein